MKSTWSIVEKSTGELKVTVDGNEWKEAQDKAFKKIAKKVQVKGFREGQAPEKMVRQMVSSQEIMMQAIDMIANNALFFGIEEQGLQLITRPSLDLEAVTEEEVTLKFQCTVSPEVTLGAYKEVEYDEVKVRVPSSEVKAQMEKIQNDYTELVLKEEGFVEEGNTAVIDFEGFKDGVAFDGGKGENYPLEIGSHTFIPGFEEQLIGMIAGEEKDINVTFPEEYQAKDLAGQPVVFKVKVNEIKTKFVPEMNDDLVKEINIPDVNTVKDLEKMIKKDLKAKKTKEAEEKVMNSLLTSVVDASTVDIPDVMVEDETNNMMEDFKNRLAQQGIDFNMYLSMVQQEEATIREQMSKDAYNKVKVRLVLAQIAKEEGIEVSDEEVEAEYGAIAAQYQMDVEKVKEYINSGSIRYDLRLQKALDLIKSTSKKKEKDA
ncbi:MAG: trigger factor [Erysipelotrichaceae bacterium]|nr:trigger factor [Erysipelotrichaceae bacterium]